MEIWQSDAACVRALKTFRMMPWLYKVLDLSMVLCPLLATFMMHPRPEAGWLGHFWEAIVALYWLAYASHLLAFVRGHFAERKGVAPSPPGSEPNLGQQRAGLILLIVLLVIVGAANIDLWMSFPAPRTNLDLSSMTLFSVLFIQQASTFAPSRFWNVSFE